MKYKKKVKTVEEKWMDGLRDAIRNRINDSSGDDCYHEANDIISVVRDYMAKNGILF